MGYYMQCPDMAFALKKARERAGLTQEELARRIETGKSTIVKLERGERTLSYEWAERIAHAVGCDPMEIYEPTTVPNISELQHMLDNAMRETPAGSTMGELSQILSASLYNQLRLFLIDREHQRNPG